MKTAAGSFSLARARRRAPCAAASRSFCRRSCNAIRRRKAASSFAPVLAPARDAGCAPEEIARGSHAADQPVQPIAPVAAAISADVAAQTADAPFVRPFRHLDASARCGPQRTAQPCPLFSNRPVGVKRFQTIHHCSVDVARGLVLLFGIGAEALPSWDSKTRWNNLRGGLAVKLTAGPSGHAISPHPSSRKGHHSTARWSSSFLLLPLILHGFYAAAEAWSRVHRNSVPSTHMRCMITASRRASATIAFFIPRRLAICIAQALSHDHFFERSML